MSRIYKIAQAQAWSAAVAAGRFDGAPVDLADGFIHFSTAAQAQETARRYFAGQADLVLVDAESLTHAVVSHPPRRLVIKRGKIVSRAG